MKILLAGGGTGGHFYPIIAVARSLRELAERERIARMDLILMSDAPYDPDMLREEGIIFKKSPAGKLRRYFSLMNFVDIFKTGFGVLRALWDLFWEMPDAIFIKGGYAAFPALVGGVFFRIPMLVHESDAAPGLVNRWAGRFARRVAVSFEDAAEYFPKEKVALIGNPIRRSLIGGNKEEALRVFALENNIPTILILGGSQGSQRVNDVVLEILPSLLESFNIVHQCGAANFQSVKQRAGIILEKSIYAKRYHPVPFLSEGDLRNLSQVASLILSRSGAGAIFEIAAWGIPSILIPLEEAANDHQRQNAYIFVKAGAASVLEEKNLKPHILLSEIVKLLNDKDKLREMKSAAGRFAKIDAAQKIARALIDLALEHAD